jgi:hypothetical protein
MESTEKEQPLSGHHPWESRLTRCDDERAHVTHVYEAVNRDGVLVEMACPGVVEWVGARRSPIQPPNLESPPLSFTASQRRQARELLEDYERKTEMLWDDTLGEIAGRLNLDDAEVDQLVDEVRR